VEEGERKAAPRELVVVDLVGLLLLVLLVEREILRQLVLPEVAQEERDKVVKVPVVKQATMQEEKQVVLEKKPEERPTKHLLAK
jgi:hypothetical protein